MLGRQYAVTGMVAVIALLVVLVAAAPAASAWQQDTDNKCRNQKYGKVCDRDKPSLTITSPKNGAKYHKGDTLTVTGTANDSLDGVVKVKVSFNAPGVVVSTTNGPWTFSAPILHTGHFTITVKAKDFVGN